MAWVKADDKLHDHRKFIKLLRNGGGRLDPAPAGLWLYAIAWCADTKSDGFVPDHMLDRWSSDAAELARRLVAVGLWEIATVDGDEGYVFHDFTDYNPTKVEQERKAWVAKRKTHLHRQKNLKAEIVERDKGRCRYCGIKVRMDDNSTSEGCTYDHVDPDGWNELDNVVIACRGCNSEKGEQTVAQWGHPLLEPGTTPEKKLRLVRSRKSAAVPGTSGVTAGSGTGDGSGARNVPGAVPGTFPGTAS